MELEEGPFKENVEALEFVYVEGVSRMKYGGARSFWGLQGYIRERSGTHRLPAEVYVILQRKGLQVGAC